MKAPLVVVPPSLASKRSHIMVDGSPNKLSRLTLSHWPNSPTPHRFRRDLSCEIVFAYLEEVFNGSVFSKAKHIYNKVNFVTLDHLDEDGILSAFAMANPEIAMAEKKLFIDAARLGDFNIFSSEISAVVTFGLRYLLDPVRTWFHSVTDVEEFLRKDFMLLSDLLKDCIATPKTFAALADEEMMTLEKSKNSFFIDKAKISEVRELSLAIVDLECPIHTLGTKIKPGVDIGIHPAAIHTLTDMPRILIKYPRQILYYDRYETWVRFISKRLPGRPNLLAIAAKLNSYEDAENYWHANPPNDPIACLYVNESYDGKFSSDQLVEIILTHLRLSTGDKTVKAENK